jgi:hypothetical protein
VREKSRGKEVKSSELRLEGERERLKIIYPQKMGVCG